jgi:acetyl-CoA/propionyl-CoA carboxylase biotin carboxyl carrier protein
MTVPQAFDSLVAKLIVTGASRREALERARRALAEFKVDGMPTVLPFHRAVVTDPAFAGEPLRVHTRWIETEFSAALPPQEGTPGDPEPAARERITVEVGGKRLEVVVPTALSLSGPAPARAASNQSAQRRRGGTRHKHAAPTGGSDELASPMQGTIVKIVTTDGQAVSAGDTIVVLEAMKMEQPLAAHKDGTVAGLAVEVGQTVTSGTVICRIED